MSDEQKDIKDEVMRDALRNLAYSDFFGTMLWGPAKTYATNGHYQNPQGHGVTAEHTNHLFDTLRGKMAVHLGHTNTKNGPDRMVDGVYIQTKTCKSARDSVSACFENGRMKYLNPDGTPMVIEVSADQHAEAVQALRERIAQGQVPGVTDPDEAPKFVRKGHLTYGQVRNIAKAGTPESIAYDTVHAIPNTAWRHSSTLGMNFAARISNGEDPVNAFVDSFVDSSTGSARDIFADVLTQQVSRTPIEPALRPLSDFIVDQMGTEAAKHFANSGRINPQVFGAAAKDHASKMFRGQVVAGIAVFLIDSAGDVKDCVTGEISGWEATKNITCKAARVAGNIAGHTYGGIQGSLIGTAVLPGVGTLVGFIVGSTVGAAVGGDAAARAADAAFEAVESTGFEVGNAAVEVVDFACETMDAVAEAVESIGFEAGNAAFEVMDAACETVGAVTEAAESFCSEASDFMGEVLGGWRAAW